MFEFLSPNEIACFSNAYLWNENVVGRRRYRKRVGKVGVGTVFMAGYPAGYSDPNQNLISSSSCYTNYSFRLSCLSVH